MKTAVLSLLTVAMALLPAGCKGTPQDATATPQADQGGAMQFTLADQDGQMVSLASFQDRTVVLEWVNPDCPFVQRHYREGTMKTLQAKWAPKGVQWLAINSTNYFDVAKNKAFAQAHGLACPILDDHDGKVGHAYGAKTTPHMIVIHRGKTVYDGAIDNDRSGEMAADRRVNYVDQALEAVTAGRTVATPQTNPYGCSVKYAK